jgi:hypothetical protein
MTKFIITPVDRPRKGWSRKFKEMHINGDDKPIIIFAACCVLFVIPNTLILIEPPQKKENIRTISAAVIQGSYKPSSSNMEYEDYIEDKTGYYMELANNGTADITIFPETEFGAYDIKNDIDKQYRERIIRGSKQLGGIAVFTVLA